MKPSLTVRLGRILFFMIAATALTSMFIVELFVDDIEKTILRQELKADAEYFKEQLRKGNFQSVKTGRLEVLFLPEGKAEAILPSYFRERTMPVSLEIEVGKTTLLIYGEQLNGPDGKLFLAQDISILENREFLVQLVLAAVAGGMLLLGYFVARAGARYMVRPFRRLTREVLSAEPGSFMPRIATSYRDQEFNDIAEAFNRFLTEIEYHIEREKLFVKLASHEFRTPLAVMSGALNVLEQRQSLSAADRKTLGRIRRAMQTINDDTQVLLELVRGEGNRDVARTIVLQEIVQNTIDDLEQGRPDQSPDQRARITVFDNGQSVKVRTNPILVRMLLRNLLQNALRHTRTAVEVRMVGNRISVRDFGSGLPKRVAERLKASEASIADDPRAQEFSNTSFGLLIVQLICERLDWDLEVAQSDNNGTEFLIHYHDAA